jgi:predicted phage tail protein
MHMIKQMFNHSVLHKRMAILIKLAFIILCLLIMSNCGKRKPPQPPSEIVAQRTEISGFQRGNSIFLSWTMPAKNAADNSTLNIERVDIYRLAEAQNSPLSLSEEEFSSESTLIASVQVSESDFGLKRISYTDVLEFSNAISRLRYAVRFVNSSGQRATLSNFLIVEPVGRIAEPPTLQKAVVTEKSINLNWDAPKTNADRSTQVNILGYNVYRAENGNEPESKPHNTNPLNSTEFSDSLIEFGKTYTYFVRSISIGNNGEPVESLDSNKISVEAKDIFSPSAPTALTIAASPNRVSIFFAVNPEKDISGYLIYRSTDINLPIDRWKLLTSELLKTNTFQDMSVESGKKYYYYLKAVDSVGNVSQPSQIVSETVP